MTLNNKNDKHLFEFDFSDLDNGISIYDATDVFNAEKCVVGIDLANDDDFTEENYFCCDDDYLNSEIPNFNQKEDCSTCYHNCNGFCLAKGLEVKYEEQYLTDCWLYRDSITMRASSDFQDDYDKSYDSFD
jgi:hypothetical protein